MAPSSPFTQAGNFLSAVQGGVDPRTGQFNFNFVLAHLISNNTLGPKLPLSLNYSPLNHGNSFGLGNGVSLGMTSYNAQTRLLQLSTGEQYKTFWNAHGQLELMQHKLDTIRLTVVEGDGKSGRQIWLTHKSGEREVLEMVGGEGVYYPTRFETPVGHVMKLTWKAFVLTGVIDGREGRLICSLEYPTTGIVKVHLWPGTGEASEVSLKLQNDFLRTITHKCSSGDLIWELKYDDDTTHWFNGTAPLIEIISPSGLIQQVVYEAGRMRFRTNVGDGALPAVARYTQTPGSGQKEQTCIYAYSDSNYMGFGAKIQSLDPDSDNLYDLLDDYEYFSTETHKGDGTIAIPDRTTTRRYNNFHLLISEKETVSGSPLSTRRETEYCAVPGQKFINQPVTYQMPKKQVMTWSDGNNSRSETTLFEYDAFGNLTKKTAPDGTVTTCEYYPSSGAGDDCPAEPCGFTRYIKSKTITPPAGTYKDVPVIHTVWRYKPFPVCQGSTLTRAVMQSDVTHLADGKTQGTEHYEYTNDPKGYEHGRIKSKTAQVWGEDGRKYPTVQTFTFDSSVSGQLIQTVTTESDEHPGQGGTAKLILKHQRVSSSITGRKLSETDASGNVVAYNYDKVGRLTEEILHPREKDYTSKESYAYQLPDKAKGTPSITTHIDFRGNKAEVSYDGLGRVIKKSVLDADGKLGLQWVESHDYDVQGRSWNSLSRDCFRGPGGNGKDIILTAQRTWDGWGLAATEKVREQGVTLCRQCDPVGQVFPGRESLGHLTTVEKWARSETDGKVTAKTRQYYDVSHRPVLTERYAVAPDGKHWEATPYSRSSMIWDTGHRLRVRTDVLGRSTRYDYDIHGRTVATTYADGSVVKKKYAPFSFSALNTEISITDLSGKTTVLGEQSFDGLGRLISTSCGGRQTTHNYEHAWQIHPSGIKGPDGARQQISTDALLGEAPLSIKATGNVADVSQSFTYDRRTATLTQAKERLTEMNLKTWASGLLHTETTTIEDDAAHGAQWLYSLRGMPESYTGADDVQETRQWSGSGLLVSITDPQVKVTLGYDSLNRMNKWTATEKSGASMDTTLGFDALGREVSRSTNFHKDGFTYKEVLSQGWTPAGQLRTRTLVRNTITVRTETFEYDSRNRLTDYHCGGDDLPVDAYGNAFVRQQFTFDVLGNILTCKTTLTDGNTDTATFHFENKSDPCQLSRVTHSLTASRYHYPKDIKLEYDRAGRMTKDDAGRTLSYDALGRLHAIKGGCTYGYDAHNRMVYQKVDRTKQAHRLYYRADRLISEWLTKGDGKKALPDDSKIRLVYAAGNSAAQVEATAGKESAMLTGTDGKHSVVTTAENGLVTNRTYTPYGYTAPVGQYENKASPDSVANSTAFRLTYLESTVTRTAEIYDNGMNQVPVLIETALQDENGNAVVLSGEQLWGCLTLKTMDGVEIRKQQPSRSYRHPSVWNTPDNFAHAVKYSSSVAGEKGKASDDESQLVVYISSAEINGKYEFYAEFQFKHFFETTKETNTGKSGYYLSHLNITTIPAIDYSQSSCWTLEDKPLQWDKVGTFKVESRQTIGPVWTDDGTVDSRFRKVYIRVNESVLGRVKIVERSVTSPSSVSWVSSVSLKENAQSAFGWGYYDDNYDVITWWTEPRLQTNSIGCESDGYIHLQAANHFYRIIVEDNHAGKYSVDDLLDDAVTLYQWDIRFSTSSVYQDRWDDASYPAHISVTDSFGNSGAFHVTFPTDDFQPVLHFDSSAFGRIMSKTECETLIKQTAKLSESDREIALAKAGAFHLKAGVVKDRSSDSTAAKVLRHSFGSQAVPSEKDFSELIDFISASADVLPLSNESESGQGLTASDNALKVKTGPGFAISGGKLVFNVDDYLKHNS